MACGWCGVAQEGGDEDSHGICDDCMQTVFSIKAEEIHAEIAEEQSQRDEKEISHGSRKVA